MEQLFQIETYQFTNQMLKRGDCGFLEPYTVGFADYPGRQVRKTKGENDKIPQQCMIV